MMNDWTEQLDAPVESQSPTSSLIIVWRYDQKTEERLCCYCLILYECIESERADLRVFSMCLADQQAGIPSGMLVTEQSDKGVGFGAGMIGGREGQIPLKPCLLQETTEGEWL
ncbi:hypothetical protein OYC64_010912 [Pagothenia borchgrevinki]|uniref:Uncharacterized protein n=1 Tax=Pagothenia borchgrevinki TaxID=8213 RepID=A0ABD2GYG4_PAGBO